MGNIPNESFFLNPKVTAGLKKAMRFISINPNLSSFLKTKEPFPFLLLPLLIDPLFIFKFRQHF